MTLNIYEDRTIEMYQDTIDSTNGLTPTLVIPPLFIKFRVIELHRIKNSRIDSFASRPFIVLLIQLSFMTYPVGPLYVSTSYVQPLDA